MHLLAKLGKHRNKYILRVIYTKNYKNIPIKRIENNERIFLKRPNRKNKREMINH